MTTIAIDGLVIVAVLMGMTRLGEISLVLEWR
jgi:hypothetical protein